MNLNFKQMLAILIAVLAVLMISSANLSDLFGADLAKKIVSAAAILNGICGGILAVVTGQTAMIKDMAAIAKDPDSPVKGIITSNSVEGRALANSIPSSTIVAAGTSAAAEMAKSGT